MQFKTSKGILNIPGEWEGVVCFEKQVSGEKWMDEILNDTDSGDNPKIGCYYYNNTGKDNLPGGTASPFYRALVKNTNGTEAGLRPFALDQNTLYVNKGNMLAYIHKSSGLSQVKVESSNKSTNATKAIQAEVAGGADKLGTTSVDDKTGSTQGYNIGSASQPVYFNDGVPVACGTTVGAADRLIYMNSNGLQAGNIVKFSRQRTLSQPGISWWTFGYAYAADFWNDKITLHEWQGSNIVLRNAGGEVVYNDGIKVRVAAQRIGSRVEANIEIILNTATALDDYAMELTTQWFHDVATSAELNKIKITHCIAVPRKASRDKGSPTLFTHVGDDSTRKKAWVVIDSSGADNKFAGCYISLIGEVSA